MLVKFSRYRHNEQFWMIPGERDKRLAGRKTPTVTEPEPDEYELYDVTADPLEQRNLAHATYATDASRRLQHEMLGLLVEQLDAQRLYPAAARFWGTDRWSPPDPPWGTDRWSPPDPPRKGTT